MRKGVGFVVVLGAAALAAREAGMFSILKSDAQIGRQAEGVYLVPTNQLLRPWGEQTLIQGRPVDAALDSKKRVLAILNWRGVFFADDSSGARLAEVRTAATSYTGIAFRPGDRELWVSETTRNGPDAIAIISIDELGRPGGIERIKLDQGHPVPAGIAFSADGDTVAPSAGTEIVTDARTGSTTTGTLSVIDPATMTAREVALGLAPSQMALSPDEKMLAAAALTRAGRKWKLAGLAPAGYFPSAVAFGPEGGLRVVSIKGLANTADGKGAFNSRQYEGSLHRLPAPLPAQLPAGTREVRAANAPRFEPAGGVKNPSSLGIQHVFFLIKENCTYDQVFGDMGKGNGNPKLCFYGKRVTPNHHALAEGYVLLDNFHTGGAISFDGHQWLMQAFVSDYVERAFGASPRGYAWNMSDAMVVPPTGFFWQGAGKPLDVRLYGEFSLPARWDPEKQIVVDMNESQARSWSDYWRMYKEGTWRNEVASRCGVPALAPYFNSRYPFSSTVIPDQLRADEFLRELAEFEKTGRIAPLSIIHLNTNHTNGTRPGSPKPASMVAENDLALGRIVEGISKSRFWPKSVILVVEDDAQDGLDHVDGHRTVALAIGPYIRRGAVDSNHYNQTSMVRTIQEILRLPPRTRALASARVMSSVFTPQADTTPYQCLPAQIPLDDMNPPLKALAGRQLLAARQSLAMNWNEPDDIPQHTLNRILWWDAKGYNTPYPRLR